MEAWIIAQRIPEWIELEKRDGRHPESVHRQQELELIGPNEGERIRVTRGEAAGLGVEVSAGTADGRFIYELKIPLTGRDLQDPGV